MDPEVPNSTSIAIDAFRRWAPAVSTLDAEVVIVGSGVASSLIAWRLAEAKVKTLILEAGPRIDRVQAFSFLDAREKNLFAPYPSAAIGSPAACSNGMLFGAGPTASVLAAANSA